MSKIPPITLTIGFASFWGVVLVAAFVTTTPKPWILVIIGMSLGCLSGHIRSRAIGKGKTARLANAIAWLCGIGLMILSMAIAEDMFLGAWAASFAGYMLLDCTFSLPARCRKERAPPGPATNGA